MLLFVGWYVVCMQVNTWSCTRSDCLKLLNLLIFWCHESIPLTEKCRVFTPSNRVHSPTWWVVVIDYMTIPKTHPSQNERDSTNDQPKKSFPNRGSEWIRILYRHVPVWSSTKACVVWFNEQRLVCKNDMLQKHQPKHVRGVQTFQTFQNLSYIPGEALHKVWSEVVECDGNSHVSIFSVLLVCSKQHSLSPSPNGHMIVSSLSHSTDLQTKKKQRV